MHQLQTKVSEAERAVAVAHSKTLDAENAAAAAGLELQALKDGRSGVEGKLKRQLAAVKAERGQIVVGGDKWMACDDVVVGGSP